MSDGIKVESIESVREYDAFLREMLTKFTYSVNHVIRGRKQVEELLRKATLELNVLKSTIALLPVDKASVYQNELLKLENLLGRENRTSSAFEIIKRIISESNHRVISSSELIKKPEISSIGIEPKALYNTLNYLASRGQLERVGRGKYRVINAGVGVETSHEIGDMEDLTSE